MTKAWKEITTSRPDTPERWAAYEESRKEALGEIVAHSLAELRKMRSVTQVELARHLGWPSHPYRAWSTARTSSSQR